MNTIISHEYPIGEWLPVTELKCWNWRCAIFSQVPTWNFGGWSTQWNPMVNLIFMNLVMYHIPSGKHTKNYGTSLCFMGKLTISMAMFNSFLDVYQRVSQRFPLKIPVYPSYIYIYISHEQSHETSIQSPY